MSNLIAVTVALFVALSPSEETELAGIIAGESIPGNERAHMMVACTLLADLENGYSVWGLRPGRWNGYKHPKPEHYEALERARKGACGTYPKCRYLGSGRDHSRYWSHLAGTRYRIEDKGMSMVCLEVESEKRETRDTFVADPDRAIQRDELSHREDGPAALLRTLETPGYSRHPDTSWSQNRNIPR